MILTSDYLPVQASFDSKMNFEESLVDIPDEKKKDTGTLFYNFHVGPLTYRMDMTGNKGNWEISFFLLEINGSREELAAYFSRAFRRTVAPSEVPGWKKYLLGKSNKQLKLGNAREVFSNVLGIVRELLANYTVRCISFTSEEIERDNIYRHMIKTTLKGWKLLKDDGYSFMVCKV